MAQRHLQTDPVMADLINRYHLSPLKQPDEVDVFAHLVGSIISQQLSVKVADVIEARVYALLPHKKVTPQAILDLDTEAARACGMSYAKVRYVKSAADAALSGLIDFTNLKNISDQEAIAELVQIAGVGQWTAEMLLIFSLGRPDVFSIGDMGLRNAVAALYGLDKKDLPAITKLAEQWSPYRSLACRYLWASLENTPKTGLAEA